MPAETYDNTTGKPMYSPATGKPSIGCGTSLYKLTPCVQVDAVYGCCGVTMPKWYTVTVAGMTSGGCMAFDPATGARSADLGPSGVGPFAIQKGTAVDFRCTWFSSAAPLDISSTVTIRRWLDGVCGSEYTDASFPMACNYAKADFTFRCDGGGYVTPQVNLTVFTANDGSGSSWPIIRYMPLESKLFTAATEWIEYVPAAGPGDSIPSALVGATVSIVPGDQVTPGVRCPGGAPIYSDTAGLSVYVGKSIVLADGSDWVCYNVTTVESLPEGEEAVDVDISHLTGATADGSYATCATCCADTWEPT